MAKNTKPNAKLTSLVQLLIWVCLWLCKTAIYYTAQNGSVNLPSHPPDNHRCSYVICWRVVEDIYSMLTGQMTLWHNQAGANTISSVSDYVNASPHQYMLVTQQQQLRRQAAQLPQRSYTMSM